MEKFQTFANPGKFYGALVLMERDIPSDKEKAKLILQQVIDQNLDKKEMAKEWLDKWK